MAEPNEEVANELDKIFPEDKPEDPTPQPAPAAEQEQMPPVNPASIYAPKPVEPKKKMGHIRTYAILGAGAVIAAGAAASELLGYTHFTTSLRDYLLPSYQPKPIAPSKTEPKQTASKKEVDSEEGKLTVGKKSPKPQTSAADLEAKLKKDFDKRFEIQDQKIGQISAKYQDAVKRIEAYDKRIEAYESKSKVKDETIRDLERDCEAMGLVSEMPGLRYNGKNNSFEIGGQVFPRDDKSFAGLTGPEYAKALKTHVQARVAGAQKPVEIAVAQAQQPTKAQEPAAQEKKEAAKKIMIEPAELQELVNAGKIQKIQDLDKYDIEGLKDRFTVVYTDDKGVFDLLLRRYGGDDNVLTSSVQGGELERLRADPYGKTLKSDINVAYLFVSDPKAKAVLGKHFGYFKPDIQNLDQIRTQKNVEGIGFVRDNIIRGINGEKRGLVLSVIRQYRENVPGSLVQSPNAVHEGSKPISHRYFTRSNLERETNLTPSDEDNKAMAELEDLIPKAEKAAKHSDSEIRKLANELSSKEDDSKRATDVAQPAEKPKKAENGRKDGRHEMPESKEPQATEEDRAKEPSRADVRYGNNIGEKSSTAISNIKGFGTGQSRDDVASKAKPFTIGKTVNIDILEGKDLEQLANAFESSGLKPQAEDLRQNGFNYETLARILSGAASEQLPLSEIMPQKVTEGSLGLASLVGDFPGQDTVMSVLYRKKPSAKRLPQIFKAILKQSEYCRDEIKEQYEAADAEAKRINPQNPDSVPVFIKRNRASWGEIAETIFRVGGQFGEDRGYIVPCEDNNLESVPWGQFKNKLIIASYTIGARCNVVTADDGLFAIQMSPKNSRSGKEGDLRPYLHRFVGKVKRNKVALKEGLLVAGAAMPKGYLMMGAMTGELPGLDNVGGKTTGKGAGGFHDKTGRPEIINPEIPGHGHGRVISPIIQTR